MKLISPNLPPEIIAYKDKLVWPARERYEALVRQGNVGQVDARAPLITALKDYSSFLGTFGEQPELESEIEWAEGG
jgi:hypothetical protein